MRKIEIERKQRRKQDREWAIKVRELFNGKCAICPSRNRINSHHIIPKEIKETRHDIKNGIALCPKHHKFNVFFSAHRNPLWFMKWMAHNRKEQTEYLLEKIINMENGNNS